MSLAGRSIGHYQVLEKLGEGGMGEVYAARDPRLNRTVAMKALPASMLADPQRRQRFLQEARAASALNHPNIITIHDILSLDGGEYLVMEFVEGKTLAELIPTDGGLPLADMLRYAIPVADALAAAHAAGIVHRDLKPANIMVTVAGHVKLLDFGLAKLLDVLPVDDSGSSDQQMTRTISPKTVEGSLLGTVSYMSPEQAEGKPVDARSDIFAFGAVLYEMLAGRPPFEGGSTIATLTAILRDEPKPLLGVAPAMTQLIARCLRKNRDERWSSMAEVAAELRRVTTAPVAVVSLRPAWLIPAAAALVVALAAFGAYQFFKPSPAPPAAESKKIADPEPADDVLDNDAIIQMVKAGLSEQLIISQLRFAKTEFDFSAGEIIRLSKEGVPASVLAVMRNPKAGPAPVPVSAPKTPAPAATTASVTPVPATPVPSAPAPVAAPKPEVSKAAPILVPDGTRVRLVLAEDVAKGEKRSLRIAFTVSEDVVVDNHVVIAKGAAASGTAYVAQGKRLFGKSSRWMLILQTVETIDGRQARLRSRKVGAPMPFEVSNLVAGKVSEELVAPKGVELYAYLDGDLPVEPRTR